MSYLLIVVLGSIVGLVGGQYLKGSEHGVAVDGVAGAVGASVLVALSRAMGPASTSGYMVSIVIAMIGAAGALYGMRQFLKSKQVPVPTRRRR